MHNLQAIIMCNGIGAVLCLFIISNMRKAKRSAGAEEKLFFIVIWEILIMCVVEVLSYLFDGVATDAARLLNRLLNSLLYALDPIPPATWLLYVIVRLFGSTKKVMKKALFASVPALIMSLMGLMNIFTDIFFTISADNVYSRIKLPCAIDFAVCAIYMITTAVITVIYRNRLKKYIFFPIILFICFPAAGTVIQALFYGVSLMWASTAVAAVLVYMYMQNEISAIDPLTGLYSRSRLEIYLRNRSEKKAPAFSGMMLDIDRFKSINDSFGHSAGDDALITFGALICDCCGKNDFPVRFAGDEFIIIVDSTGKDAFDSIIGNLNAGIEKLNASKTKPYSLSYSYGYTFFGCVENDTPDSFFKRMDSAMYINKNDKYKR